MEVKLFYDNIMGKGDPRVNNWLMMSSPWPCFIILAVYLIFVLMGPTIMKDRKPLELKNVLFVYNFSMVILTGYCGLQLFIRAYVIAGYTLGCEPVDYSDYPNSVRIAEQFWLFYICKLLELLDTVFFVLRKKFTQASFLHVSHHFVMPFIVWMGTKFVPGGISVFFPTLNSFVHTAMYTYYGLSALGPEYQKYIWWKRYMTKIQLTQFAVVIIHASQLFFVECEYPMFFAWLLVGGAVVYMVLFSNFYFQAYIKNKSQKTK